MAEPETADSHPCPPHRRALEGPGARAHRARWGASKGTGSPAAGGSEPGGGRFLLVQCQGRTPGRQGPDRTRQARAAAGHGVEAAIAAAGARNAPDRHRSAEPEGLAGDQRDQRNRPRVHRRVTPAQRAQVQRLTMSGRPFPPACRPSPSPGSLPT